MHINIILRLVAIALLYIEEVLYNKGSGDACGTNALRLPGDPQSMTHTIMIRNSLVESFFAL